MCVPTRHSSANRRGVQNIQFRAYGGRTVYAPIAAPIGGSARVLSDLIHHWA